MELQRLLMFSPEVYQSLVANYNVDWMAVALIAAAAGIFVLIQLLSGRLLARRILFASLSMAWFWIGIVFHGVYHTSINWVAHGLALLCVAQGLLLLKYAVSSDADGKFGLSATYQGMAGLVWLTLSLGWGPAMVLVAGVPLQEGRFFGMAPEVVAWTTLAMFLLSGTRRWWLLVVLLPVALVEGLTASLLSDRATVIMWWLFAFTLPVSMLRGRSIPNSKDD